MCSLEEKLVTFRYSYMGAIQVVSEYVYLGVTMMYNNKYVKAMKKKIDQARKVQFSILVKARNLCLPIDIQYDMFEKVISPILLYGSAILEIFHRYFLKKTYCI